MEIREDILVLPKTSIRRAMEKLDKNAVEVLLVVDRKRRLKGTVADSDIRRGILRNISLEEAVEKIMNPEPIAVPLDTPDDKILQIMRKEEKRQLPLINEEGVVIGLKTMEEILHFPRRENYIVIMAGGEGRRLRPITEEIPKPMLQVGQHPILQTIISSLRQHGFFNIFISVYYKSHLIKEYFGDGKKMGVKIKYLRERKPLGTAGALSLLPAREITEPILVMNADLLTNINFGNLLDYHIKEKNALTVCVKELLLQVPYGVVDLAGRIIQGIKEKPQKRIVINAGIYALSPEILKLVPSRQCFNMPELVGKALAKKKKVGSFSIHEYWLDIGHIEDYYRARSDYYNVFEQKRQ